MTNSCRVRNIDFSAFKNKIRFLFLRKKNTGLDKPLSLIVTVIINYVSWNDKKLLKTQGITSFLGLQ